MTRRILWALIAILVVATILRGVGLGELCLIGDESYYWLWSQRLEWAYYDHPAGVALLIRASTALGGAGEAGVRWLNAFLGVGCVALTYLLGQRMFSRQVGLFAAVPVAIGAPYLIASRFVYTNTLHLFLLLTNIYAFWHLAEERKPRLGTAMAFGISLALLFNTKYSAYLYAVTLIIVTLVDYRRLLVDWRFWVGVLIGVMGLAPVVAWNSAHGWASFRWQLSHATASIGGAYSLLGNIKHALAYLTWPIVAVALIGLGRMRAPAERLLTLVALFLLLPVALSPANSPRNLTDGLVPLFLLTGTRLASMLKEWQQGATAVVLSGMMLVVAVYGVGTIVNLSRPSIWPHSSVVPTLRKEAAGWQELRPTLAESPAPIFALDYSIASQLWYITGRPAYTAWGQYRIWGIPNLENATIVSLDHLPAEMVSSRLWEAFEYVEGPQVLVYTEQGLRKEIRVWQTRGLGWDQETFLQQFDFLTLLEAAQ